MTLCNMSIEAGARCAMVGPDEATLAFLAGRPFAPQGAGLEAAVASWRGLATDPDARFDRELRLEAGDLAPMVTWGISPEDALPISARAPDPGSGTTPRAAYQREALAYMGLEPGQPLASVRVAEEAVALMVTVSLLLLVSWMVQLLMAFPESSFTEKVTSAVLGLTTGMVISGRAPSAKLL